MRKSTKSGTTGPAAEHVDEEVLQFRGNRSVRPPLTRGVGWGERFAEVGPDVEVVSGGAGHDRVQDCRTGAGGGAADEQPVLATDR